MTIGEVAHRAGVATSTIRYYERRGLLTADARQSGQRRYQAGTLRRLVFIGMMQDIGLSLDEVQGILDAATAAQWKSIAGQRLAVLDEQIAQLRQARGLLAAALHCRYDHPATDCNAMGAEIDRRLAAASHPGRPGWPQAWPSIYPARVPELVCDPSLSGPASGGADE